MADTLGNENPANNEEDVSLEQFDAQTDKEVDEAGDDPARLKEIIKIRTESRQKLYARTKEAETKLKTFASEQKENKNKKDPSKTTEVKEFDYGQKAFLIAKGIDTEEAESFLFNEVSETGKTLSQLLSFNYVQEQLKSIQEQKNSEGAIPKASGERGGQGARTTVDYWIQKGELPPEDQIEMRRKVVNEKLKRSQSKGKFGGSSSVQIV